MKLKFWERWTKPQTVQLLDGTPGTFLAMMRKYSDTKYTKLVIIEANKPHDTGCVICDEPGGEFTIYGGAMLEEEDGEVREVDLCWAVHEEHFESSVNDDGNPKDIREHGTQGRRARR